MSYNILDIIEKSFLLIEKERDIYKNFEKNQKQTHGVKIIVNILIKDLNRTLNHCKELISIIESYDLSEIDFLVYDKISSLMNQFNRDYLVTPQFKGVKDILDFALDIRKKTYGLMIDIQGRILTKEEDTKLIEYKIVSKMIEHRRKQIENLEKLIKGN